MANLVWVNLLVTCMHLDAHLDQQLDNSAHVSGWLICSWLTCCLFQASCCQVARQRVQHVFLHIKLHAC